MHQNINISLLVVDTRYTNLPNAWDMGHGIVHYSNLLVQWRMKMLFGRWLTRVHATPIAYLILFWCTQVLALHMGPDGYVSRVPLARSFHLFQSYIHISFELPILISLNRETFLLPIVTQHYIFPRNSSGKNGCIKPYCGISLFVNSCQMSRVNTTQNCLASCCIYKSCIYQSLGSQLISTPEFLIVM